MKHIRSIVYLLMLFVAGCSNHSDNPRKVEPVLIFHPKGIENISTDFYSAEGRYGFVYMQKKEPIAYYWSTGLFIGYNHILNQSTNLNPTVYVYDMWGGDNANNKVKEIFGYKEYVDDWGQLRFYFESGTGEILEDRYHKYPTDEISQQIEEKLHNQRLEQTRDNAD